MIESLNRTYGTDGSLATGRTAALLERLWADGRLAAAAVIGVATLFALLSAWWTPRGPITTGEALATMGVALLVGLLVGLVSGRRWSLLAATVAFLIVFEIARAGVDGPTVDGIHLGSLYGMIAFVVGRLFHGVLALVPLWLGALYGIWLSGRLGNEAVGWSTGSWLITGLLTVAILVVAMMVVRPGTTPPILGADGAPQPGSVAELVTVPIGGHEQALMIRGRSTENPVLLYLAGGPGGTDLGAIRRDTGLEQDFVVVSWEQRGVGKSYAALDPVETLTLDQMVADTIEVTNYLRDRFDEEKIYIVGNSWGATLGVLAVQQHPELYHAYIGTGQMVSQRATDIMFWEDTIAWAEQTGNDGLVATLRESGPPPYASLLDYEPALSHEHDWNPYPELDLNNEMPAILFVRENTLMDRINGFRSFLDTFSVLYPQLQEIDFRRTATQLEVPVYMLLGEHEVRGRAVPANEWFAMLSAPTKESLVFEGAGHRAHFDRPAEFADLMRRVVDETYPAR